MRIADLRFGEQCSGDVQVTRESLWRMLHKPLAIAVAAGLMMTVGCGGSSPTRSSSRDSTGGSEGAGALAADARSAATGDIPDTQNFRLTLTHNPFGVGVAAGTASHGTRDRAMSTNHG